MTRLHCKNCYNK